MGSDVKDGKLKGERRRWPRVIFLAMALTLAHRIWRNDWAVLLAVPWGKYESQRGPCNYTLDDWIVAENQLGWTKIFGQIGPLAGANEGFVIASPSNAETNYLYTWTRDSAIVMSMVLTILHNSRDPSIESHLRLYAYSQKSLQHVCNPSGCFEDDLKGLGEPKFNVDGTAFTGPWGRPQRDGPALRAIALVGFADYLLDRNTASDALFVKQHLYSHEIPPVSVIKADLEYVARHWHEDSWDLWEELDGQHFFTIIVSVKALEMGAALANRLDDDLAFNWYFKQADLAKKKLENLFLSPDGAILAYEKPSQYNRTGFDASVPLGVLMYGSMGAQDWGPANDHVLATLKLYVDSFRNEYPINKGEKKLAVATGRYREDIYDGVGLTIGNPWYFTTIAVPHVIARAVQHFAHPQNPRAIHITEASKDFWAQFDQSISVGDVIPAKSRQWRRLLTNMAKWSEGFWEVVRKYQGPGGRLDEQINRDTGLPQGAQNLTWSYASFYLASLDREKSCQLLSKL